MLSKYDETGIGSPSSGEDIREAQPLKEQRTNCRKKVEEGLKNRRDKKLSSKLSMDTQLLNISKEELSLKRKLVEQLEKSEEEFNSGTNKVFKSMENISSCIRQTAGILAHLANQQQTPYQQQYRPPFSPPSFNQQSVPQYGHPSQRNVQNENQGDEENERVHETYHDRSYLYIILLYKLSYSCQHVFTYSKYLTKMSLILLPPASLLFISHPVSILG